MKGKRVLFVAVAVALLAGALVLPALAEEEPVAMFVSQVRLAYNGRSSHSPDRIVALVHVRDVNQAAVEGALVSAVWTLPDGSRVVHQEVTAFQGIATFSLWAGKGAYSLCVTGVSKAGFAYDPELNGQTCGELLQPWPW